VRIKNRNAYSANVPLRQSLVLNITKWEEIWQKRIRIETRNQSTKHKIADYGFSAFGKMLSLPTHGKNYT